jgi:arylsulfatase A-like enzyme/tetratricopeptide (TPR) repeat protein
MRSVARFSVVAAVLLSGCAQVEPRAGVNLLVVTIDTLRPDRLGAYGYASARTPNLDHLAAQGVLFEDVTAQVPLTLPSHASLFTGLVPPTHGVRDNTFFRLDEEAQTLAEMLEARGYQTAAFVGAFVLDHSFGLNQGFELYDDAIASGAAEIAGTVAERRGEEITRSFTAWLSKRSAERPFFAWLHYFDPHLPYAPPAPYPSGYEGEIAYVDSQIGSVLAALEASGVKEDTLIAITSDHGESLGEHGEKTHGFFVYDATLRVPLILSGPALPAGRRIAAPVRGIDILPTVLEALAAEIPERVQGASLLPLIDGEESARPGLVYAECYASQLNFRWAPLVAIREEGFKYIEAPRPELYDLTRDPGETKNLVETDPERGRRMRARLAEIVQGFPESRSARTEPDPETVARLRSLGYTASEPRADSPADLPDPKDRLPLWRSLEEVILQKAAGDLEGAAEGAKQVLEKDTTNLLALEILAEVSAQRGDREEALAFYRRSLALDDTRALTHVLHGNLLWQTGDLEGAEESFLRAVELDFRFVRAHRRLGELYLTTGRTEKAKESFSAAAAIEGNDPDVGLGLARTLRASGDASGAALKLEELHRLHPADPGILAEYAAALAQTGDADRAIALLRSGPDHPDVHYTLSVLLRSRNDLDGAIAELDRAIALRPKSAAALHDRGVILSRVGRLPEAIEALESAIAVQESPASRNALGVALCRMERCSEAIPHFERAVAAAPEFVEALENLAQAYEATGLAAEARRAQRKLEDLKAGR